MKEIVRDDPNDQRSDFMRNPHGQNRQRHAAFFYIPGVINGTVRIERPEGVYEKDFDKRTPKTFTPKGTK